MDMTMMMMMMMMILIPIVVTLDGMVTDVNAVHSANAVIPSNIGNNDDDNFKW